jgi:hypothetical protein
MSHKHGERMRHCVCSGCPAGASLLYVIIQRSSLYIAVVVVLLLLVAASLFCTGLTGL